MTLAELLKQHEGETPQTPFYAFYEGRQVLVRTLLHRTAVLEEWNGERGLALFAAFTVDTELVWIPAEPSKHRDRQRAAAGRAIRIRNQQRMRNERAAG